MNKQGKTKEMTLGGAALALIVGLYILNSNISDTTGLTNLIGWVFTLVGGVGLIAILVSYFK